MLRSPSRLGKEQVSILEEILIFHIILWLHIETRESGDIFQKMDALRSGVMENQSAHSLGNAGVYAPIPIHNKLGFSKAAFGNPALLPGFFQKAKKDSFPMM